MKIRDKNHKYDNNIKVEENTKLETKYFHVIQNKAQ